MSRSPFGGPPRVLIPFRVLQVAIPPVASIIIIITGITIIIIIIVTIIIITTTYNKDLRVAIPPTASLKAKKNTCSGTNTNLR